MFHVQIALTSYLHPEPGIAKNQFDFGFCFFHSRPQGCFFAIISAIKRVIFMERAVEQLRLFW
jgi:hypothetical protein